MSTENQQDPRYPVGKFQPPATVTEADLQAAIATISEMPTKLRAALNALDAAQFEVPYRDGGWNSRQVVHHVADSHSMALSRVKLALTEDWPTISAYKESLWAQLADVNAPLDWSLQMLDGIHGRWVMVLKSLTPEQWQRGFAHPEKGRMTIQSATLLYQWHCHHHVAHITNLRAAKGW